MFKGVSTNVPIDDFKELLEFNKITHAEAERMTSKRSGRDLPFIKIKRDDPKQAEALISGGFICQKTGIIFKVEEFRTTPLIQQFFKCQGFGHKAPNSTKKPKFVVCGEAHSHKNCPNKEKRKPKCANCRGPHVANHKGCPAYKDQAFRQHVVQKQVSYASILKQASPPPPSNTFNFTAEQIVSLVTNVVIQVALPQLCTKNLPEKQVQVKSDLSRQIAETAQKCLGVSIEDKEVFESITSRPAPPPPPPPPLPAPFVFSSTLVEKKKAPLKASTVLKVTPTSSSSTKSTKTPSLGPHRKSSSKLSPPQPRQNKTVTTKQSPRPSPTRSKPTDWSSCQVPPVGYNHLGRVEIVLFIGMNIGFWNCQGLRPKRKELQNYLLENQIDILALNKTFLKPKFKFHLLGYDIYKNDRLVGTKGGIAILVKKGIIVNQECKNYHFNVITDNEALVIETEHQNWDKVILATFIAQMEILIQGYLG